MHLKPAHFTLSVLVVGKVDRAGWRLEVQCTLCWVYSALQCTVLGAQCSAMHTLVGAQCTARHCAGCRVQCSAHFALLTVHNALPSAAQLVWECRQRLEISGVLGSCQLVGLNSWQKSSQTAG